MSTWIIWNRRGVHRLAPRTCAEYRACLPFVQLQKATPVPRGISRRTRNRSIVVEYERVLCGAWLSRDRRARALSLARARHRSGSGLAGRAWVWQSLGAPIPCVPGPISFVRDAPWWAGAGHVRVLRRRPRHARERGRPRRSAPGQSAVVLGRARQLAVALFRVPFAQIERGSLTVTGLVTPRRRRPVPARDRPNRPIARSAKLVQTRQPRFGPNWPELPAYPGGVVAQTYPQVAGSRPETRFRGKHAKNPIKLGLKRASKRRKQAEIREIAKVSQNVGVSEGSGGGQCLIIGWSRRGSWRVS